MIENAHYMNGYANYNGLQRGKINAIRLIKGRRLICFKEKEDTYL